MFFFKHHHHYHHHHHHNHHHHHHHHHNHHHLETQFTSPQKQKTYCRKLSTSWRCCFFKGCVSYLTRYTPENEYRTQEWRFGRWFSSSLGWFFRFHLSFPGCTVYRDCLWLIKTLFNQVLIFLIVRCSRNRHVSKMFFSKSTHIWKRLISMFIYVLFHDFMANNAPLPCTSRGRIWINKFIGAWWVFKDVRKGLLPIFRNIFSNLTHVFQVTALNMIIRSMYGILPTFSWFVW